MALPSLDRLAGLIERVVELVDEVAGGPAQASGPSPASEPAPPERVPAAIEADDERGWLAFIPSPHGYALVPQAGPVPAPGEVLELDGTPFRVVRRAPSPLPGDRRRCAVVEREEPPAADRSFGE